MLLHWCTLEPSGPSNLAAIRFSSPVRIRSVRVFPKHAKPFAEQPDITSETEPDAFFLDLYFNAHPISSADAKQKQKASNALVPTTITYAGSPADYEVAMGNEYATRLMIVKGNFVKVSLAIYGDIASELPPAPTTYTPSAISSVEPTPLSAVLDPSNSEDPTALARKLLVLIPDAPPLPLIVRLMFCLKPSDEDWDLPDFPYLPADIDEDVMDFDLETAFRLTNRPVPDDTPVEVLQQFADRVVDAVGPKNSNQAFLIAGILSHSACQHPEMARLLIDRLDIRAIFDVTVLQEDTLLHLLIAATNPDIARHLLGISLTEDLLSLQRSALTEPAIKSAAQRLTQILHGWDALSDALSNTRADFGAASAFLLAVGRDEPTLGAALHALIAHTDLVTRLAENAVVPRSLDHPPLLLDGAGAVSHDEFIAFLRAWIGVACVLAVYAWADSVPNGEARERALGILRVWQEAKGYREILNNLLLLRQMIYRLECMIEDNAPSRGGILAEDMLKSLSRSPAALLSPHLNRCISSLQPGLCAIADEELEDLHALADVADGGVAVALEDLMHPVDRPLTPKALSILRVALATVSHEVEEGEEGEWRILGTLWDQGRHGLTMRLVDILSVLSEDIQAYFTITSAVHSTCQGTVATLLLAAEETMHIVQRLAPLYPLPGRHMHALVGVVADLFACSDAADMAYSPDSDTSDAAQRVRQTSIDLVQTLAHGPREAEVVLRTLLHHGTAANGRDPAYHLLQVFSLVDNLLPMPHPDDMRDDEDARWVRQVLPRVLPDLTAFVRLLDLENRTHFVRRLADLDGGAIGIGEWLVLEELKLLRDTLKALEDQDLLDDLALFRRYEVSCSLRLVRDVVSGSSSTAQRIMAYVARSPDAAPLLTTSLQSLLSTRLYSLAQVQIAQALLDSGPEGLDHSLLFIVAMTFLRAIQYDLEPSLAPEIFLEHALTALKSTPIKSIEPTRLCTEIGEALIVVSNHSAGLNPASADLTVDIMDWLVQRSHAGLPELSTLHGISHDTLSALCDALANAAITPERGDALEFLRISISGASEDSVPPPSAALPDKIELSLHRVDAALRATIGPPTTPTRTTPPQAQGMLGLVTVSPPTALLRSPAVTGLTKTYNANDFRQLRQLPSARQNTSRMPSKHVDEFESTMSSPAVMTGALPNVPGGSGGAPGPFDNFPGLAPPFSQ